MRYHSFIRERLHEHQGLHPREVAVGIGSGFFFEL